MLPQLKAPGFRRPLAVALLAVLAHVLSLRCGWIWDDDSYITKNLLVQSSDGLFTCWIPGATPQYYPLVFSGFWAQHQLTGLEPFWFHLVNLLMHAASAALFLVALRRLEIRGAFWAAAIFAVHPMGVESVAWVTERKNVQSLLFAIASVLLFIRFMEGQGSRSGRWWFASFGCFLAALLSKTTAVFVPPCLVMIMLWQRRRVDGRAWRSVSPFFAAGLALGLFTAHMEKTHVGATGDDFALGLLDRLQLAGQVSTFYLRKFFVPDEQVFIYRRFDVDASNLVAWWPAIACGALLLAAAARWTRNRGPLLIALWIGAALFPALGFFDVWPFRYSYVADHFAYAAMPALALTGVIVAMKLGERLKAGVRVGVATGWSAVLVCTALALLATPKYESEEVLWRTTFAQNPTAWIAANNIASIRLAEAGALVARGETAGVEERAREALAFASAAGELKPDEFTNAVNRSEAHRLLGQKEGALREIETATTLAPRLSEVHWMRGRALEALGRIDEARGAFTQAASLAATPREEIEARRDLMRIAVARSELPDALRECERMVELDPSNPDTTANLGSLLLATGKRGEARAALLRALSMPPNQFSAPSVWVTTSVAYLKLAIDSDLGDGERRAARAVANRLAALSQGDPMARYLRAALEFAAGDPAAAGELESLSAQARGTGNTLLEQEIDRFLKSRSR